jgi:prepilin-type N-terminal cleavage/methylation domain-containing protein
MLLSKLRDQNQGFSLIEVSVIVAVMGLLAASAAPSFLRWVNNAKADNALAQVEGALKEAQAEAIKRSQPCTVTIGQTITASVTGSDPAISCLSTGPRNLDVDVLNEGNASGLTIATQGGVPASIQFSHKGSTISDDVIVIFRTDNTADMKCLAISNGIGIMRTGNYTGDNPAEGVNVNSCITEE